jgi:Cft2 family RNA processing exonuclease
MGLTWRVCAGSGGRPGSAFLVESDQACVLVDAGCGAEVIDVRPDALILTHAHNDHIRGLAGIIERYPGLAVYSTAATKSALRRVLKGELTEGRANAISDTMIARKFQSSFEIGDLHVLLRRAGHIAGAAMVEVSREGRRVLVTGDFSRHAIPGVAEGADFEGLHGGTLLMECSIAQIKSLDSWKIEDVPAQLTEAGLYVCGALGEAAALCSLADFEIHENLAGFVDGPRALTTSEAIVRLTQGGRVLVAGKELTPGSASWQLAASLLGNKSAQIAFVNRPPRRSVGDELLFAPGRTRLRAFGVTRKRCRTRSVELPLHTSLSGLLETVRECHPAQVGLVHNQDDILYSVCRKVQRLGVQALVPALDHRYPAAKQVDTPGEPG